MKRLKKTAANNRGVALITVILIVSILVAAALELNRSSRADIYDAANLSDGTKLLYIAKSGFYGAAALVVNSQREYDSLRDDWAKAEGLSAKSQALFAEGHFIVRVEDENGKIPLNKLVAGSVVNQDIKNVLIRLLSQKEFDLDANKVSEIVDAIIDWIDQDDDISSAGAESSYYSSLTPPYTAKNAPLDCIEELLMIKSINSEIFAGTKDKPGLAQFVTVHGSGAINLNTAPQLVMRALSSEITPSLAEKMDAYRRNEGNNLSYPLWYQKVSGMEGITIKAELITLVKSNYFKISATGKLNKMERQISGIIQRSPLQVMNWRQD